MNFGTIDYASTTPPTSYRCTTCGVHGCKLWREYQTCLDYQTLSCCDCAGKSQGKDVSKIDAEGRFRHVYHLTPRQRRQAARRGKRGRRGAVRVSPEFGHTLTEAIGWRVPAVPTEDGSTYWGYGAVPDEGAQWWRRLPTRSAEGRRGN